MSEEETVDIEQDLEELLTKVQPDLQDVIKRSFTNVALQQCKNGEQIKLDLLPDTSYFAKNTQVNLSRLELVKSPTFHMQALSLDLKSMALTLRCSLGEVNVRGLYSAFNENLYNLIPVMAEGHVLISLSNMTADVNVGLVLEDDAFSFINPGIDFMHDEVLVKLSWPSPQKSGGYEFATTEQMAKHIDDLPLTAAISLPLYTLLREKLQRHLSHVLKQATSVSEVMCCNPSLYEAYMTADRLMARLEFSSYRRLWMFATPVVLRARCCPIRVQELGSLMPEHNTSAMVDCLAHSGNKVVDMILINMRRTLLQSCREVLELPPIHATFMHKIGSLSFMGKFETDTGWLKNLATVNRINDVSVSRPDPTKTSFHVTLRVKDLQIGYEEYRIKAMEVSCSGRLAAAFASSAVHMAITVGLTRWEPYAQLDDLRVQTMDCMDLHVTGLGPLSGVTPLISAWTRGASVAHAAPALAAQLQHELHTALAELPLWDLLHGKQ